jgi:hypothetical protein
MIKFRWLTVAVTLAALAGLLGKQSGAMAQELRNAADLEHAVLGGKDIHVTLDLSRCTEHGTGKSGPEIRGSMHPDGFIVQSDHGIAFAVTHFTVRPDKKPVLEFTSFLVEASGRVDLHSIFLNAANYTILHEAQFDCEIGSGVTFN